MIDDVFGRKLASLKLGILLKSMVIRLLTFLVFLSSKDNSVFLIPARSYHLLLRVPISDLCECDGFLWIYHLIHVSLHST